MNKLSREYVVQVLMPTVQEIIEKANREGCRGLDLAKDFIVVPVHYMQGAQNYLWELGFVPKKVDFDGGDKFTSIGIFLYNPKSDRIRGPNDCVFLNGQWERYPD